VEWRAYEYPITIAELKTASKELERLLTQEEINGMVDFLACNPEIGEIMPRTGGVRKMRWPCASRGKRSGLRILYYFHDLNIPLYILAVYSKGEKLRPTAGEEREMATLVKMLIRRSDEHTCECSSAKGSA
jgi:mRNA-degrading endonuclease RelE of RelBE toxin-antitoxin system